MAQVSYPGVYIEEFAPAPPIQPAATSVAAFVGFADPMAEDPAPIGVPIRITSFSQFQRRFGTRPVGGFYLWYAVRGFFENGGTDCFVVRASNGKPATWMIKGAAGGELYRITSKEPSKGDTIEVEIKENTRLIASLGVFKRSFEIERSQTDINALRSSKILTVIEGHLLRPGDLVQCGQSSARVLRIMPKSDSANTDVYLDRPLGELEEADNKITFSLAPIARGENEIRLENTKNVNGKTSDEPLPANSLVAGAIVKIADKLYSVARVSTEFCNHPQATSRTTYRVLLRSPLQEEVKRDDLTTPPEVSLAESLLKITHNRNAREYRISADQEHPDYAPVVIRANPLINLEVVSSSTEPGDLIPAVGVSKAIEGKPEDVSKFNSDGASLLPDALESLRRIPEVNMVAIPDACGLDSFESKNIVMQAIIAHCETMAERFGILDAHAQDQQMFEKKDKLQSIEEQMGASRSTRGYAALYYPWIRTRPAAGGRVLATVPPSGHVCGLLARVDKARGVHKAPANETLNDAVAITQNMTDQEQGTLNLQGINVIRTFTSGGRPTLFGARTTASDKNWQYVNIRRLFLFLEESISTALRSSLFEPNNTELWGKLNRVITAFLTKQWQDGALFGKKADEAFYVKIDEELNPRNEQKLGKLNIEIGVCPTYPAEFIVVRIGIWDGGMTVSEG